MADGKVIIDILGDASDFTKTLQGLAGKGVKALTAGVTAATAALTAAAGAAAKLGMEYETATAKLQTISGAEHIGELSADILSLSNSTGKAAADLADVAYNAISAGVAVEDAVGMAETATKLATAGFTDTSSALSVLTTALNSYGDAAGTAEEISDSLIQVQNLGVTTVAELSANMGKAIATGSAYGVSLGNLESAYVSITKAGINTAEGTTYLNSMMNELGDTGSDIAKIIKKQTGKSFSDLMGEGKSLADVLGIVYEALGEDSTAMMNLWGSAEAGKAANAIINQGLETFNSNLEAITDSAGATESAYETMANTMEHKLGVIKTNAQNLGIAIYENMAGPMGDAVDKATEWVQQLSAAFDEGGLSGLVKETGTVLADALSYIVGQLPAFVDMGVELLGALLDGLTENSDSILESAGEVLEALAESLIELAPKLIGAAKSLVGSLLRYIDNALSNSGIGDSWNQIKDSFLSARDEIAGAWESLSDAAKPLTDMIESATSAFEDYATGGGLVADATDLITDAVDLVSSALSTVIDWFAQLDWDGISSAISFAKDSIVSAWNELTAAFDPLLDAFGSLLGLFDQTEEKSEIFQTISDIISCAFALIGTAISLVIERFTSAIETITSVIEWFTNLSTKATEDMTAIELVVSTVLDIISTNFSTVLGVIQGVVSAVTAALQGNWSGALQAMKGVASTVWSGIKSIWNTALTAIKTLALTALTAVKTKFTSVLTSIKTTVSTTVSNIVSKFNSLPTLLASLPSRFLQIGSNIVSGIWNGISAGWSWLVEKVKNLASSLLDAAKSALGIASPSKKFRKEVGRWIPPGIGEGVEDAMPELETDVRSELSGLTKKATAAVRSDQSRVNSTAVRYTGSSVSNAPARRMPDQHIEFTVKGRTLAKAIAHDVGGYMEWEVLS